MRVWLGGDVQTGDDDNAAEGGDDPDEFADGKFLDSGEGADDQSPDARRRGENRGAGDGSMLEAGHCEIVSEKP